MTREQKIQLIALIEEKRRREHIYRYRNFYSHLYPWQHNFISKTAEYSQVCLMAANRVGKTYTGTYIDAIHAMGDYPELWEGHKFTSPPLIWLLGYSSDKIRDLLQTPIFGEYRDGQFTGGLIPAEMIVDAIPSGVPRLAKEVKVRHKDGISRVQFWSYSQGQHALMGDSVDWYHIDEEPKDQTIFPQVLVRTAAGDRGKGGRGILTFTPENGRTELVMQFMDAPSSAQTMLNVGWNDAPHLSEKVKEELLASFPAHQRDMRTRGIPMLGHGRIYDLSEDFITCDPFPIPQHFRIIGGMDFGYDHPQAQVKLAIDLDNDIIYLTNSWKASKVSANDAWGAVSSWQRGVPVAWPHDGLMHEKARDDAKQQKDHYQDAGFNMLFERATWDGSSNSVEQGIYEIRERMMKGTFKVFSGNRSFFDEFQMYHRDDKGRIVKSNDDVLDAVRYAYMMRRYAKASGEIGIKPPPIVPPRITPARR